MNIWYILEAISIFIFIFFSPDFENPESEM